MSKNGSQKNVGLKGNAGELRGPKAILMLTGVLQTIVLHNNNRAHSQNLTGRDRSVLAHVLDPTIGIAPNDMPILVPVLNLVLVPILNLVPVLVHISVPTLDPAISIALV